MSLDAIAVLTAKVHRRCETTKLLRDFSLFILLFRYFELSLQQKAAKLLTLGNHLTIKSGYFWS